MPMPTAAQVLAAFYSGQSTVPFLQHLGVAIEQGPSGPRARLAPKPDIVDSSGRHSPATVYVLGEFVSSMRLCDEVIPRAVELELGVVGFTVSSRFRMHGPASGTIEASASMVDAVAASIGGTGQPKKAKLGVAASVRGEHGELVGDGQFTFYVRLMEMSRVRKMAPESSLIFGLHDV